MFSPEGIELQDEDFCFVKSGDEYFYSPKGNLV